MGNTWAIENYCSRVPVYNVTFELQVARSSSNVVMRVPFGPRSGGLAQTERHSQLDRVMWTVDWKYLTLGYVAPLVLPCKCRDVTELVSSFPSLTTMATTFARLSDTQNQLQAAAKLCIWSLKDVSITVSIFFQIIWNDDVNFNHRNAAWRIKYRKNRNSFIKYGSVPHIGFEFFGLGKAWQRGVKFFFWLIR